jgi:hypothetical protein
MKQNAVSDQDALAAMKAIRSDAKPIAAFQDQLALFKEVKRQKKESFFFWVF